MTMDGYIGEGGKSWGWDEWQQQGIMSLEMGGVCKERGGKFNFTESTGCVRNILRNFFRTDLITLIDMVVMRRRRVEIE